MLTFRQVLMMVVGFFAGLFLLAPWIAAAASWYYSWCNAIVSGRRRCSVCGRGIKKRKSKSDGEGE